MSRILIVGMSPNPGGVETYLLNFMHAMKQHNELVFLNVDPTQQIAYADEIIANGAKIFEARGEYSLTGYLHRTKIATQILKAVAADVVYVNALTPNLAYWIRAATLLHIRSVYHSHNDAALYSNKFKRFLSGILRPYNLLILKNTTQLACSQDAADFMYGNHCRSILVYNAIDSQKWAFQENERSKIRKSLKIDPAAHVVISVGRLHPQKNYPKVLEVMARLVKIDPLARLLIVGDGDDRVSVEEQINSLGLETKVLMLGRRTDVPNLMWASDVLLMPSIYEGLPFIVVEAQGAGLQVLATKNIVPEIANVTGKIFGESLTDANNEWAENIKNIINTPPDRLKMNELMGKSKFSIENYTQQIVGIFDSLQ